MRRTKKAKRLHRVVPQGSSGALASPTASEVTRFSLMSFSSKRFREQREVDLEEVMEAFRGRDTDALWVDVTGLADTAKLERMGQFFGFHPLSMEDVVHVHQRPKLDRHPEYLFVTLRMPLWVDASLELEQLSVFVGRDFVVSIQERAGDAFEATRGRLRAGLSPSRTMGPAWVLYSIIDAVIDNVFPLLERYELRLDLIEEAIIAELNRNPIPELLAMRKEFQHLRWALLPLREVVRSLLGNTVAAFPAELAPFWSDCLDHLNHAVELLENEKEVVSNLVELHISLTNQRMNEVMKVLTIIATVFIPLSFIASLYGMNFDTTASPLNMPELSWRWGYPFVLGLMLLVSLLFLGVFWRRGWLGWKPMRAGARGSDGVPSSEASADGLRREA